MARFFYLECPDCEWSCILDDGHPEMGSCCPVCAEDCGRDVTLTCREATDADEPEGYDARLQIPDCGPYWIEMTPLPGGLGFHPQCGVVDLRQPNPDPDNEGGKGFAVVFTGTFAECDAWIEAHS